MGLTNAALVLILPGISGGTVSSPWSNANANTSVGDSATAFAITQTELQAATNRFRQPMVATYPQNGGLPPYTLTYQALFATSNANYAWQEWGTFNSAGSGGPPVTGGTMLQRFVQSLGTKTSAQSWQFTTTLTFVPS